jgi:hypothetical protein
VEAANKRRKDSGQGFKEDLVQIADWCITLHCDVNWSAHIVGRRSPMRSVSQDLFKYVLVASF